MWFDLMHVHEIPVSFDKKKEWPSFKEIAILSFGRKSLFSLTWWGSADNYVTLVEVNILFFFMKTWNNIGGTKLLRR